MNQMQLLRLPPDLFARCMRFADLSDVIEIATASRGGKAALGGFLLPTLADKQCSTSAKAKVLSYLLAQQIASVVDLQQCLLRAKCALKECPNAVGPYVPCHTGGGLYGPLDGWYDGPLATKGEACSDPQEFCVRFMQRYRTTKYLVVCSVQCWREVGCWKRRWPGRMRWQVLRGTRKVSPDEIALARETRAWGIHALTYSLTHFRD